MIEDGTSDVAERLRGILTSGDPAGAPGPEALADAEWLEGRLRELDGETLEACADALLPYFLRGDGNIPGPLLPLLADAAEPVAREWLAQAGSTKDPVLHGRVADVWQRVVAATGAGHPRCPERRVLLALARWGLYGATRSGDALDGSVEAARQALEVLPEPGEGRAAMLSLLRMALWDRHRSARGAGGQWAAGSRADLDEVIETGRQVLDLADALDASSAHVRALLADQWEVLRTRYGATGTAADLAELTAVARRLAELTAPGTPEHADRLADLGVCLRIRLLRTGEPGVLDESIEVDRRAARSTADGSPRRAHRFSYLGISLFTRFENGGEVRDLEEAVDASRTALAALPAAHAERPVFRENLLVALRARSARSSGTADHDEIIGLLRQGADEESAGPGRTHAARAGETHGQLAELLLARHLRTGAVDDLARSITDGREALRWLPGDHAGRPVAAHVLARALTAQAWLSGELVLLDEAVGIYRHLSGLPTATDGFRRTAQASLAAVLWTRHDWTGDRADLDEAVTLWEEVTRERIRPVVGDELFAEWLSAFAEPLRKRFERYGADTDLTRAIALDERALDIMPAGSTRRPGVLVSLGASLRARFERTGRTADLDRALALGREGVRDSTPAGPSDRAGALGELGITHQVRFRRFGDLGDLDASVERLRAALAADEDAPRRRPLLFSALSTALSTRYAHTGSTADLDDAIDAGHRAVRALPEGHPSRGIRLSHLGVALQEHSERHDRVAGLEAAVALQRQAVEELTEGHPGAPGVLSNHGTALLALHQRTGAVADLDEAVTVYRRSLDRAPEDDPGRAGTLSNLGGALRARYALTAVPRDLDDAVSVQREALALTPENHYERVTRLHNLAHPLLERHARTRDPRDLGEAVGLFVDMVSLRTAPAAVRIRAAWTAAAMTSRWSRRHAARLLEAAVRLLPEVAPRRLDRDDQQHGLGQFAGLAADAAALVLGGPGSDLMASLGVGNGEPALITFAGRSPLILAGTDGSDEGEGTDGQRRAARALGLLELGRGVLLGQALDTRDDALTLLYARKRGLARRYVALRGALGREPIRREGPTGLFAGPVRHEPPRREEAAAASPDRQELARAFAAVQDRIRALGGEFERFGLPPTEERLRDAARHGPVVIVNVSRFGSHALLLTGGDVRSLPLTGLTPEAVTDRATAFHQALSDVGDPDHPDPVAAQAVLHRTLEWLWDTVAEPVLDDLGIIGGSGDVPPPAGELPRVWWVPGGALSRLPLHAAGHHRDRADGTTPRTVMDRTVSSYTPTVRALHHALGRAEAPPVPEPRTLVVAVPGQPGPRYLSTADDEAALVAEHAPGTTLLTGRDAPAGEPAALPTVANVLRRLPEATVAHFACHGLTDSRNPSHSHLVLREDPPGTSGAFTVADLAAVDLSRARLAYLSACRTAVVDIAGLQDESIHLTSAFLIAGFPHVIGTLWQVQDDVAYDMADTFYRELRVRTASGLALPESARALRAAAVAARDSLQAPSLWAAHIHTGA
ncbi:CHAT domain-containing protein [Streptomyces sp. NRRL WC-3626]|uniref:CHAT domain-containing protein n=1 Tax=Streptomyces sp. NRRL WC-3626 TaxID=1463926 RepID=UPI00068E62C6|nr:CHAT domain-containing protein [Streptomyces sp. NRRL WC-3626]